MKNITLCEAQKKDGCAVGSLCIVVKKAKTNPIEKLEENHVQ